jgi:hypothetical protein
MSRLAVIAVLLFARTASAESIVQPPIVAQAPERARSWPLSIGLTALLGVEPHTQADGSPAFAFGVSGELMWRARVGGFVSLLSSEGTLVLVTQVVNNNKAPSLPDRISVPFGVVARPFTALVERRESFLARLAAGVGVQLGLTVENLRTSDDSQTVAGLHLGLSVDVPLWGGPVQGGAGVRLMGRGVIAPSVSLDSGTVTAPVASGQFYAGFCWWP